MAIKPTTAVFSMRSAASTTADFTIGQSQQTIQTVEINTNLDTLNREVLLIQEIDFDVGGIDQFVGVLGRTAGSANPTDFFINGGVTVILTEVDPAGDPSALNLDSPHFIASKALSAVAGLMFQVDENPDTASYNSQAGSDHPLFTTAAETLYLSVLTSYQGNDPAAGTASPVNVRGLTRIMAQRGRADADTYAAILTGLFS